LNGLKKIWNHLSRKRQTQLVLLLSLMILASMLEIISLGAVLPFLGVLTSPERVFNHQILQPLIELFKLTSPNQLILPVTIIFISAIIFAAAIRLMLLYSMTRLAFSIGADLSIDIYRRTIYQEYAIHISRNSSEIINGIITKTGAVINGIINPALVLISSTVFIVAIISTLLFINLEATLVAAFGFGGLYWIVSKFTRHQLKENSQCIARESTQMIKSLQEGLGGIRDILIDSTQNFYCNLYRNADHLLRKASAINIFISSSPRFLMEPIGMIIIVTISYAMSLQEGGLLKAIPILGVLALSTIRGSYESFNDVLDLLDQPLPNYAGEPLPRPMPFNKLIQLKNLSFKYKRNSPLILNEVNLTFRKGMRIGFVGKTGSGKSTLLDIIMGLLSQTKGQFKVDGKSINNTNRRSWQANIAHVPQNIFLSDNSIQENIAFGVPLENIDFQRVRNAAKQAQIAETIEGWPEKYETIVGERGVRLSGGQRQRIGIARALYKNACVLILDEATSALDNETEKSVMSAIETFNESLTILIIAHRVSTLQQCDLIIKLTGNGLKVCTYDELVST
jgi:ATP-binding cassette, subfamily B, bacterial PglK